MTAGIFREHGVFFGLCGGPVQDNRRGRVENRWLKQAVQNGRMGGWPESWLAQLRTEGWDGCRPWGAKLMPKWWPYMREQRPTVVVLCFRPMADILESCSRVGWARDRSEETVRERWAIMEGIERDYTDGLVVRVDTPDLARGDYGALQPAFDALELELSADVCRRWVDPGLFHV